MKWSALTKAARENFLSTYQDEDDYSGNEVIEMYKEDEELKAKGFDIDEIYYSGFSCQGDGARWKGRVDLKKYVTLNWLAPEVAVKREVILALLDNDDMSGYVHIDTNGSRYQHSNTMQVRDGLQTYFTQPTLIDAPSCRDSIFFGALSHEILEAIGGEAFLNEVGQEVLAAAKELADTIYEDLEKEYDYQHSEECVSELAEANDWDFTEEGEMK